MNINKSGRSLTLLVALFGVGAGLGAWPRLGIFGGEKGILGDFLGKKEAGNGNFWGEGKGEARREK